jgi:hypothetical protein
VLSSVDETEIPQLREHLAGLCRQDGLEAHCRAQLARVGEVAEQVMRFVDERKLQVEWQRNATREQAEAAKRQLDAARSFRDKQVSQISDDLREHLRSAATRLGEQLSRAIERAEGDRQHLRTAWDGKHWATLRAAARWGADGLPFCGSTGRHDFARDATAAMLNKLMVPWADHFEDKLTGCLDEATRRLCDLASGIWDRLRTALQPLAAASPSDTEDIDRYLRNMVPDLEFHLGQSREQATKDIAEVRRSAYERLPREVRERMKPAFRAAAEERGLGMKQRMVDKIFRRLDEDFDRCMEEVEVQIVQEARQLNDGLQRRFDKMKSGFVTQSDRAFERFGTTSAGKSEAELKDRERRLDEALQHLAQLDLD